ncbi:transcriptional regulator [Enemella dayhoffiae]|uniref:Transcriptional regulator n=1 Tax=Enemella dayhoffiae TaxID=2016507 RepID=A0A255GZG7_9ACTN|nr:LCP family protein [Enemella dayhoffiae]OYO21028.1 transcriptional regulator [Enemella dayhoffiae]
MPGDDMDWLYRSGDARGQDPDRTRAIPASGADLPTNPKQPAQPSGQQASPPGRRRASFGDPGTPPRSARQAPQPAERTRAMPTADVAAGRTPTPAGSGGGRGTLPPPAPGRTRKPRRPGRTIARVLIALLVAWIVFLIGTPLYAWSSTNKVDAAPAGQRPPDQPGTTWLIVGSDSREGLSEEERKKLGTGDIEGQRTDTMMLLYAPPGGKPVLVSIPRDSYVTIPGRGKNKVNAAYAIGGPKLLVQTVEQNTGLRVDHYGEIGFGGFVNVIDALGGIEMCPKTAIKDKNSHLDIPGGCQNMDGVTALGYVRMRYADPTGDLGRMNRQREMVAGVAKKAASPLTVLNPFRWWGVNVGAAQSVKNDRDTGVGATVGLISPMMQVASGQGLTLMVPVSNPNASTPAGSSMLWDTARAKEMFGEIARGDTSRLDRFAKP